MDLSATGQVAIAMATQLGLRVLGAVVLWIVGRMLIGVVVRLAGRALAVRRVDETISRYLGNILSVVLNIALAMAILSVFGVETTTFAALIAAVGLAVGIAWGGLTPVAWDPGQLAINFEGNDPIAGYDPDEFVQLKLVGRGSCAGDLGGAVLCVGRMQGDDHLHDVELGRIPIG